MVSDPYSVLGVPHGAGKEEIKKAYRKKAKEYHPDFHQNDSSATQKMNEINEAYDMLMNPEKYQQKQQKQSGYQNTYQRTTQQQTYYGNGSRSYNSNEENWGFGFEDIFGFGTRARPLQKPVKRPEDSQIIFKIIDSINIGAYDHAIYMLNQIVSYERNARWHYLNAIANHGAGKQVKALEEIEAALKMDPDNREYMQAYTAMKRTTNEYRQNGQDFQKAAEGMQKYCMSCCALHFFCTFCRCY